MFVKDYDLSIAEQIEMHQNTITSNKEEDGDGEEEV